jgi:hypothetical protein
MLTKLAGFVVLIAACAGTAHGVVLISDSFETDSSANYTVVNDGSPDGTRNFQFDYVAAGLPLAPRSTTGNTKGLRLTANDTGSSPPNPTVADAQTLFHNTSVSANQYRLRVDVWINFLRLTSSTEHAHVGVGGNGTTFNQLFTPISGSGSYIGFDGDGGSGSDYRWFRSPDITPIDEAGQNTTLANTHRSYLGNGSNNVLASTPVVIPSPFWGELFPAGPGPIATRPTVPGGGVPSNRWTTLQIDVDQINGRIGYFFDGALAFLGRFSGRLDGLVSLGIGDLFASVDDPVLTDAYVLYDNLTVETFTGAGGGYGDFNADGAIDIADYTVWRDALGATVAAGVIPDASVNGVIDQADYKVWSSYYGLTPPAIPATAVPEPAGLALVAASAALLWRRRR